MAMEEGPLLSEYLRAQHPDLQLRLSKALQNAAQRGEERRAKTYLGFGPASSAEGLAAYAGAGGVVAGQAGEAGLAFVPGEGIIDYGRRGHKKWGEGYDALMAGDPGKTASDWIEALTSLAGAGADVAPLGMGLAAPIGWLGLSAARRTPKMLQTLRDVMADTSGAARIPGMGGDTPAGSLLETPVDQWPADKLGFRSPTLDAVQSMVDDPKVQSKGTVAQMLKIAEGKGAKPKEMEWMNLGQGQEKITKDELLQQATERRIELEEVTLAGEAPVPSLDTYSMDVNDEGMQVLNVKDRTSGATFEVIVDDDAGNVMVQAEGGEWLDVEALTGAKMNRQNDGDAYEAIEKWLEDKNVPSLDIEGPNLYGPDEYPTLWLEGGTNHREVLLKMPSPPAIAVRSPSEAVFVPYKAQWDELNEAVDAASARRNEMLFGDADATEFPAAEAELNDLMKARENLHAKMVQETIAAKGGRPDAMDYTGGHYAEADQANVIAHNRVQDMTYADGKKGLHWDEGQSDWAKQGRKSGYLGGSGKPLPKGTKTFAPGAADHPDPTQRTPEGHKFGTEQEQAAARDRLETARRAVLRQEVNSPQWQTIQQEHLDAQNAMKDIVPGWGRAGDVWGVELPESVHGRSLFYGTTKEEALANAQEFISRPSPGAVPDMPFKGNAWQTLNFKRMLRYAVENGYERLTWAPGQVHKDRYNLEQHLDRIEIWTTSGGVGKASEGPFESGMLRAYNKSGEGVINTHIDSPEALERHVGKEVAQRLLDTAGTHQASAGMGGYVRKVEGAGLKMGGEWADNLYDKQYPNIANKELKRLGIDQRVGQVQRGRGTTGQRYEVRDDSGILNGGLTLQDAQALMMRHNQISGSPLRIEREGGVGPALHSIEITPELKEAVMGKGMTMFSAGGMLGGATAAGMLSRYQGDEDRAGI